MYVRFGFCSTLFQYLMPVPFSVPYISTLLNTRSVLNAFPGFHAPVERMFTLADLGYIIRQFQ